MTVSAEIVSRVRGAAIAVVPCRKCAARIGAQCRVTGTRQPTLYVHLGRLLDLQKTIAATRTELIRQAKEAGKP